MKKLTLSLVLIMLCGTFGIGWVIDQYFESQSNGDNKDIIAYYKDLGFQFAKSLDNTSNIDAFTTHWNKQPGNQLSLVTPEQFPLPAELESDFIDGNALVLESDGRLSLHYYLPNKSLVLTFTPDELSAPEKNSVFSLLLTALFYLGIIFFVLVWLYPLIKRLNMLRSTATELGSGDLSKRIPLSRSSYIGDIEIEFNRMANRIETLVTDNKLISSAVSHDLRTPLARLRMGLDVLSESTDTAERENYQNRLNQDLDEMQSLIEVLLHYAKLEQSMVSIEKDSVDLSLLLLPYCKHLSTTDKPIDLVNFDATAKIKGNEKFLMMLFSNIIGNAIKYANKRVSVEIIHFDKSISVEISDDGPGVDQDIRTEVLKPFIKYKSEGFGMGLAIADRISQWHNGQLKISESSQLGGTKVQVLLPTCE
jgi:two-component system OmpR family sensor kinase